jgi:hypothetical protein
MAHEILQVLLPSLKTSMRAIENSVRGETVSSSGDLDPRTCAPTILVIGHLPQHTTAPSRPRGALLWGLILAFIATVVAYEVVRFRRPASPAPSLLSDSLMVDMLREEVVKKGQEIGNLQAQLGDQGLGSAGQSERVSRGFYGHLA